MRQRDLKWLQHRLPPEIRALTVRQPFAWAISKGHKSIENRSKPPPRELLGEIVAIHAAKAVDTDKLSFVARRIPGDLPKEFVTGAIIGFARIVGWIRSSRQLDEQQRSWYDGSWGWLFEDFVTLPEPIECSGQLGFWHVPRAVMNGVRRQFAVSTPSGPTAYSWGYKGWGNATNQLIELFDTVERLRGFNPPIFVDIRAKRECRAAGFKGSQNPFERELGSARYRWMRDLGNKAVLSGHGSMRLIAGEAVYELLGLIFRAEQEKRRVVFFCSCASPSEFAGCHRRLVSKLLVRTARRLKLPLRVEEWPGGEPKRRPIPTLRVQKEEFAAVLTGGGERPIHFGRTRPPAKFLSLPVGAIVRLKSNRQEVFVSVQGVELRSDRWQLSIFLRPVQPDDTQTLLFSEAGRVRTREFLTPISSFPAI